MDGTAFSCYLQNKTMSGVSVWTVPERCTDNSQISENYDPLKTTCKSCGRNFRTCKPWRRKSLLGSRSKWTWCNIFSSSNLLLLLSSLSHVVLNGLSRTISTKKTSKLRLHLLLLLACFLGGIFMPFASCQESLQPTPSFQSQLPNAVVYVGSAFSYNISTSVFDCEVDNIVVSETADRFLSHWLSYNSEKKRLYGIPSDKDEGTYNILVVALTKDSALRGHICGSRSFSIVVMPVSQELPVSVHFDTEGSRSYHKSPHSLACVPGTQAVLGAVVLNADMQSLNGHERMVLLSKMADHLNIHASKVSFFPGESSHPLTAQLDNPAVMAAGVGDGRFAKGSRSLLTWIIGCGAFKLEDAAFSRLETDAQDGTISTLLGFPVVGWHVVSGAQKNMIRRRVRRAAGGIGLTPTPTPTTTSAPPTSVSSMSTSVIRSRTVTLTSSAVSVNSTVTLSTSATSSVTLNTTIVQSTGVSINTVFSQSLSRTMQSSTLSVNLTVSSLSPNRTDIQSSVSINVTTSSQSFSRTVTQSSSIANFSSSMTSFSPTSIFNSSILMGTSSTPVLSRNQTQVVNRTSSLVTTPSLNSTFTTRTASPSISLSVSFISSLPLPTTTRAQNSSSFVISPNESATFVSSSSIMPSIRTTPLSNVTVLVTSTQQLNSTEITRTSQFAVSSNITTLIASTSLLSSPSQALTTFPPTSVTVNSSSKFYSSTPNVTLPALTTLPTLTVITSNSSVTIGITSVLVTTLVNQTSLSMGSKVSNSSSILSAPLTSTFLISASSSLVNLFPNTTSVENATSLFVTGGLVTSSVTIISSTLQLESTSLLNRSSPMPISTFLTTSIVATMTSTQRSFAMTSSLVSSLNFSSIIMISSSLIQPSSTLVSSLSSGRLNVTSISGVTSVVGNITSATLQPSVTPTPTFVMSSLTASPLVTSVNLTSVAITVNTTSSTLSSSSSLSSSNATQSVTVIDASQTVSVLPTSSVPASAPPTLPPNLPPVLLNNIGRVRAPAGKALQFIIPDDTFYDREDRATTRDLTLSMTLANGSSIPTDFWLQFDTASQTINGLPLDEHVPDGILGQVLVLRARDNNSADTFDAFEVLVVPSEKPVVQELRVRITNEFATFNRDLALRLALLKKIAAYYDDEDESKIRVLSFSSGSVIMIWTNDSLPTDSCDEEKLQYVTNKMLLPNGEVKEEFREALQGFPVVSASEERFGVCNGSFIAPTETPIDPARKEARVEENLWYKHVLVGLILVLILIVLVVLLIWYCRRHRPKPWSEKRTFKKRKPIVLGPEIELKPLPGKPLVLPDDDPSSPPSYISETSFNKPTYSDDEDEEDYGKRSPSVVYEPPPPFYPTPDNNIRNSPPPAYLMPPMY